MIEQHDISKVAALKTVLPALQALCFTSLEQLVYAAQVAAPELELYLGVSIDDLLGSIATTAFRLNDSELAAFESEVYALGASVDNVPLRTSAPVIVPLSAEAATGTNLIGKMPPIRDQGKRGACVAFAVLAAYEHSLTVAGAYQDLSEEFMYWSCKESDGIPSTPGTWLGVAVPALRRDGVCLEETWRYDSTLQPTNEGHGPPPPRAQVEALTYRPRHGVQLAPTAVSDIKAELASGHCVAFSIPVFNSWYRSAWVAKTGDITMPVPGEARVGGHAMCFVGYQDLPLSPELDGGRFLIRNSWGARWGWGSPLGAGYGTIPYGYIARSGKEAFAVY